MRKIFGDFHAFPPDLFKVQEKLQIFQALLLQILPFDYVWVRATDVLPGMIFRLVAWCFFVWELLSRTSQRGAPCHLGWNWWWWWWRWWGCKGEGGGSDEDGSKGGGRSDLAGDVDLHGREGLGMSKTDRVGIMVFHFVLEMVEMSITFWGRHFAGVAFFHWW